MTSLDLNTLFGVKGKTVLITGGSRGIGKMVRVYPAFRARVGRLTRRAWIVDCYWLCAKWRNGIYQLSLG